MRSCLDPVPYLRYEPPLLFLIRGQAAARTSTKTRYFAAFCFASDPIDWPVQAARQTIVMGSNPAKSSIVRERVRHSVLLCRYSYRCAYRIHYRLGTRFWVVGSKFLFSFEMTILLYLSFRAEREIFLSLENVFTSN